VERYCKEVNELIEFLYDHEKISRIKMYHKIGDPIGVLYRSICFLLAHSS
jgi:hypothetical protein